MSALPELAAHLWSVHDLARDDFAAAIDLVADAGYTRVETMGFGALSVAQAGEIMAERGVLPCAAHVCFEADQDELEAYARLGVTTLAWSLEPGEFEALDRLLAGIERVNRAAIRANQVGLHVAYHNHFAEFTHRYRVAGEQVSGYDLLQDQLDPSVTLELDLYWPRVAGATIADLVAGLLRPLELVHLKDGPALGMADVMRPVDARTPGLVPALAAGPRWAVVELDRVDGSIRDALAASRRALLDAGLVQDPQP